MRKSTFSHLAVLFILAVTNSMAQSPGDWQYAVQAGGSTADAARAIATDAAGNSYVTGYFDVSATFAGTSTITLNGSGGNDIFVAKYDATGQALWAVSAGGNGADQGLGIAIDMNGNSYVTGHFTDTAIFMASLPVMAISNGQADIFVAKYDVNGELLWLRKAGGLGADYGNKISLDAAGYIYVTGFFPVDTLVFYGTPNDSIYSNGGTDIFIAKFNPNGDVLWARNEGGSGNDIGNDVAADAAGNVYAVGSFLNKAYFYTATGKDSLTALGSNDMYALKLDPNGDMLWVRQGGSNLTDIGNSVVLDTAGNVYMSGTCNNSSAFSAPIGTTVLSSNGFADIFLVSYDTMGNIRWAKHAGGSNSEFGGGIDLNASNHLAITGGIGAGAATFYGSITNITLTSNGSTDIFVAEYDTAGNVLCAQMGGSAGFDRGWDVSSDAAGNSYLASQFSGTATFQSAPSFTLTAPGSTSDIFIGKWLSSCSGTSGVSVKEISFSVFPNPASDWVHINAGIELEEVTVLNSLGQIVLRKRFKGIDTSLDISALPTGTYTIRLQERCCRLIKQ